MFIKTNVTIAVDNIGNNKERHKKIIMKVNPYSQTMHDCKKFHNAKICYCVIVDFEELFESESLSDSMLFYNNTI